MAKDNIGRGRSRAVRPEQKSVSRMKDLVIKLSNAGQVVLEPCAGTFPTAKACIMVPKHLTFVGCEIDRARFDVAVPSVVEVFSRQVLNEKSYFVWSGRVQGAAKIYLEAAKSIAGKRRSG